MDNLTVNPDKRAVERICGQPKGRPGRHSTRKETAKSDSRLGQYPRHSSLRGVSLNVSPAP